MNEVLKIEHLKKYYGNSNNITKAVDDITFNIKEGEFVAIMGASGSGKTTLLNTIATIDNVTSGHIYVGGIDITTLKEKDVANFRKDNLGFNLLDALSIGENIAMSLVINGENPEVVDKK